MNPAPLALLPERYRELPEPELLARIVEHKRRLGPELCILAHHYQRQEVVDLGDFRGDSYELCRRAAASVEARFIVFCGVHFMAEAAAVLARPEQKVFIPDPRAGCPMADMAEISQVERAWAEIEAAVGPGRTVPITYMNSDAALKAFCGYRGGAVCTSSNAGPAFNWAFGRGEKIFFFPDEHLGRNTAAALGIAETVVWDPEREHGGLVRAELERARVILWQGYCHVHTNFTADQVREKRAQFPGAKVIVHPECPREVVALADASGSTGRIIRYVEDQPAGSTIVVGTEIHLVERLARLHAPAKKVVELAYSLCPNMYRINLHNLLWVLDGLASGPAEWVNAVEVPGEVREGARLALQRMLELK